MRLRRLYKIAGLVIWFGALVGAVRKVLTFSRAYMRDNIGHEHMYSDRYYVCLWFWPGNYIFLTDVYGKNYKDVYSMCTMINSMDFMFAMTWSLTVRSWHKNHGKDPRYQTCRFNALPAEIISSNDRWRVWRYMLTSSALYGNVHCPDTFCCALDKKMQRKFINHL